MIHRYKQVFTGAIVVTVVLLYLLLEPYLKIILRNIDKAQRDLTTFTDDRIVESQRLTSVIENGSGQADKSAAVESLSTFIKTCVTQREETLRTGFDVQHSQLKFLNNAKSNCFLESVVDYPPDRKIYENVTFVTRSSYPKKIKFGTYVTRMSVFMNGVWVEFHGSKYRLRCLPYFMLLGVAKSGTTDISSRMLQHPGIAGGLNKELYWWNEYRYSINSSLSDYADLFDPSTQKNFLAARNTNFSYFPIAIGEFTSMTFFNDPHCRDNPVNQNVSEPKELMMNHIKKILPNVKLLVILRDPVSRLYSHYSMSRKTAGSPEKFHRAVQDSIFWWENCTKIYPRRQCAYGSPLGVHKLTDYITGNPASFWPSGGYSCALRESMYSIYTLDWLRVFDRDSFLFIKFEEYVKDPLKYFNEVLFPFLDLHAILTGYAAQVISSKQPSWAGSYKPMLPETKELLQRFYKPFNEELSVVLNEHKWLWNENTHD